MTNWPTVTLCELVEKDRGISYGIVQPGQHTDDGVPIVRVSDVRQGRVSKEAPLRVSNSVEAAYARTRLRGGELLISVVGTIGETAIVPADLAGWNVARAIAVLPVINDVGAYWVKLALQAPAVKEMISGHLNTTVQPTLNLGVVKKFPILMPPRDERERIASILGAYDDLIEVNRQRIAVLEEMARRLFEEWFVHFRFPGHERHAIVVTPEGELPEGWQSVRLDAVARVNADTIKPANAPERIGYVDIASVMRGDIQQVEWQPFADAPGRARRRVRDGSIIWSMVRPNRRSYAIVFNPDENLIVSTGFAVLDASRVSALYLYHYVTSDNFVGYLVGNTSGAAYPAVTGAAFERASVLLPPENLDSEFNRQVEPMLRLVDVLRRQSARLASSRDLLLPRLISGEVSVTTAQRELEAVA